MAAALSSLSADRLLMAYSYTEQPPVLYHGPENEDDHAADLDSVVEDGRSYHATAREGATSGSICKRALVIPPTFNPKAIADLWGDDVHSEESIGAQLDAKTKAYAEASAATANPLLDNLGENDLARKLLEDDAAARTRIEEDSESEDEDSAKAPFSLQDHFGDGPEIVLAQASSYKKSARIAKITKIVGQILFALGAIMTVLLVGAPWILVGVGSVICGGVIVISWIKSSSLSASAITENLAKTSQFVVASTVLKVVLFASSIAAGLGALLWTGGALAESCYNNKLDDLKRQYPHILDLEKR